MFVVSLLYLAVLCCAVVQSATWASSSPPDGMVIDACSGDSASFSWQYQLSSVDVLGDVQWIFDGQSQEMIAMIVHGQFLPFPTFGNRVSATGNAGITLHTLVAGDSGNYTVEVHIYSNSGATYVVLRRTVFLQVSDVLMVTDGPLHVTQSSEPVFDPESNHWAIQLQCGTFIIPINLPFEVEWITPSGSSLNSTGYKQGQFFLSLNGSLEDGNYSCRIPQEHRHTICLAANSSQGGDYVFVDKVDARLALLEKENHQRQTENQQLRETIGDQQGRIAKLEDASRNPVAFHATHLLSESPADRSPIIFSTVHCNQGGAYNSGSGIFVVPYNGLYYFISTSGPLNVGWEYHGIYVDNTEIAQVFAFKHGQTELSTVHGLMHLRVGQHVYVQAIGASVPYDNRYSSFTGFMLSRDF